jgi:CBS domain-containing protein
MNANKPLLALTAMDLMSREVVALPSKMSMHTAGHLLTSTHITGAPVVNDAGQCVGVLSATDFMNLVGDGRCDAVRHSDSNPGCFHSPWQADEMNPLPTEDVQSYMTANPVMVAPETPIGELARLMIDAQIHRIIVVNEKKCPIGVVSSTDVLAAVASAKRL